MTDYDGTECAAGRCAHHQHTKQDEQTYVDRRSQSFHNGGVRFYLREDGTQRYVVWFPNGDTHTFEISADGKRTESVPMEYRHVLA